FSINHQAFSSSSLISYLFFKRELDTKVGQLTSSSNILIKHFYSNDLQSWRFKLDTQVKVYRDVSDDDDD
ncbi:hypothetical protein VIGAN_03235200, partial [Vigna angularis var. angularis]